MSDVDRSAHRDACQSKNIGVCVRGWVGQNYVAPTALLEYGCLWYVGCTHAYVISPLQGFLTVQVKYHRPHKFIELTLFGIYLCVNIFNRLQISN